MDKEKLQQDISDKNKALKDLEAQILASSQQTEKDELTIKKKKLEEEIQALQKKHDELKKVEENIIITSNKNEEKLLKNDVDVDNDQMYEEFIKGGDMYKKLESIL